jgi:hypothetical protein
MVSAAPLQTACFKGPSVVPKFDQAQMLNGQALSAPSATYYNGVQVAITPAPGPAPSPAPSPALGHASTAGDAVTVQANELLRLQVSTQKTVPTSDVGALIRVNGLVLTIPSCEPNAQRSAMPSDCGVK